MCDWGIRLGLINCMISSVLENECFTTKYDDLKVKLFELSNAEINFKFSPEQ